MPAAAVVSPRIEIGFEPNQGQFPHEYRYSARAAGYQLDLSDRGGAHVVLHRPGQPAVELTSRLRGANARAEWQALDPLASRASYFHGARPADWQTNVPMYARLRQANVYPGIDLVYHGNPDRLEYDFVVAPGADPARIQMQFSGAQRVALDAQGNLVLDTAAGPLVQHQPALYQLVNGQRRVVPGKFVLQARDTVAFQVGEYDRRAPLVIDPTLGFASFIGGTNLLQGNAIALDTVGNLYIAGTTYARNGGADILLRKFSSTGAQVFVADMGGSNDDFGQAIKVGSDGSVYVGGRTNSSDFPVANAFQRNRAGGFDAFLMRVDGSGQRLIFSTFLGGSGDDQCRSLAVDATGSVYATGTAGGDFPLTQGVYQPNSGGGLDAFVTKFDNSGNRLFSTLLGGSQDDEGFGVAVDLAGNVYVTGTTLSDNFPQVNNPYQHSRHGDVDAFVTELNPSGAGVVYSTYLGGGGSDQPAAIAVDGAGSAYITGKTGSSDYPTTRGAYSTGYSGGDNDIFVTKMMPGQGGLSYSTYIGSHGNDEAYALAVDSLGNVYLTGDTDSDQYPTTGDATQRLRIGNRDAVVSVLNSAGSALTFSTFLGGSQNDVGYGIALGTHSDAYVTGITSSRDFPATSGAFQSSYGGDGSTPDAFFAQILFSTASTTPGAPTINVGGIVNGANFASGSVAPGSVISIFGTNFATSAFSASGVPLPTQLGGTTVLVNGAAAPLFYVGPNQINFQVPYGLQPGGVTVQVQNGTATASSQLTIAQTAPAVVTNNGRAVVVNQNGTVNTASNPAHTGNTVVIYFTGIGPVNNSVTTGAGSPFTTSTLPYNVTIGGQQTGVAYLGLTPSSVGLAQANVVIPGGLPTGDVPVVITINGVASAPAMIAVAP